MQEAGNTTGRKVIVSAKLDQNAEIAKYSQLLLL